MALVAPAGAQTPPSDPAQAPSSEPPRAHASESALATLSLSAVLNGGGAPLTGGLRWRIFAAQPDPDGAHPLNVELSVAQPTLTVPPGEYVVHASFGLASAAKRVTLGAEVRFERLTLSAGALRIEGTLADAPIDPSKLSLAIYVPQNRNPLGKLVYDHGKAGDIIGLPEGSYHIVSTFLDTVGAHSGVSARQFSEAGGGRVAWRDTLQFDRQRRHQGYLRQADRRNDPPSLRHDDAQARQQARR